MACVAVAAGAVHAATLTPEAAWQRACANGAAKAPGMSKAELVYTALDDTNTPAVYVFSGAKGGFMLVGADDVAAPLIGYSTTGSFDPQAIPENLLYWMSQYSGEISAARAISLPVYKSSSRASMAAIEPLMGTKWDQSTPYNDLCPEKGTQRTVTGCVATALAQAMNYHKYPEKGSGSVTYYLDNLGRNYTFDLGQYTLDWANMANVYNSKATAEQRTAVAQLMAVAGAAVEMQYGTSESSSSTQNIPIGLIKYLGYDKGVHYIGREFTPYAEWESEIYNNLRNIGPVVMGGHTAPDNTGSGHCWVCDGYDGDGYYHMNWGWGGLSDGYYLLTALDPMSQGIGGADSGFNYTNAAVIGMQKPKAGSEYWLVMYVGGNVVVSQTEVSLGRQFNISFEGANGGVNGCYNGSAVTIYGTMGVNLINSKGESTYVAGPMMEGGGSNGFEPSAGIKYYSVALPKNLADGTYTMVPAWMSKDYVCRNMVSRIGCRKGYTVVVSGGNAKMTPIDNTASVKVTDIKAVTPTYTGVRAKFDVTVSNSSADEYYGQIRAGLFTPGSANFSKPAYNGNTVMLDVEGNSTLTFTYETAFGSAPAGEYDMYFYNPESLDRLGTGCKVKIEANNGKPTLVVSNFRLKDGVNYVTDQYNMEFDFDIECTDGVFDNTLMIGITQGKSTVWRGNFKTPAICLFAGQKMSVSAVGQFSYGKKGVEYAATLFNGTSASAPKLAGPLTFTIVDPSGITDVDAGAEVVSTRMYNLQGVEVPASTTAPGHYILVTLHADGTTTATHILK